MTSNARLSLRVLLLVLAAAALAGCETTGTGAATQAAKAPEPPMTHTRAAEQCWMSTEKGSASLSLDKRADLVNKCIDEKMKAASGTAEPAPSGSAAEDKKKKQAGAAGKKKPAAAAAGEKDKKPDDAEAPDKKP